MRFYFVPESVEIAASCVVVHEVVAGMGDPKRSHRNIRLQHGPSLQRTHRQIMHQQIVSLYPVLDKIVVSADAVSDVVLDGQEMHAVESDDSGH